MSCDASSSSSSVVPASPMLLSSSPVSDVCLQIWLGAAIVQEEVGVGAGNIEERRTAANDVVAITKLLFLA